jgi:Regulator of ribonuclease activity B
VSPGFLERLLRGKPPEDTAALDQLVVRQLRGLGADLAKARHVRHFLYFEHERDARAAADEIAEADYDVSVTAPEEDEPNWLVVGQGYRVIGADTVAGFREFFEQVSERHHGEYDGWEPAAKP